MPEQTIAAFEDHGTLGRTMKAGLDEALDVFDRMERVGVDMGDVGKVLEGQGGAGGRGPAARPRRPPERR